MEANIIRIIKKRIKYSDYKNYIDNKFDRQIVGVNIKKGDYDPETKEIELIVSFDEFFLKDLSGDSTIMMTNADNLLKRFHDTREENIIFGFQFKKMMQSWGIESKMMLRDYSTIDDEYVYTDAAELYKTGKISEEQYNNIIDTRHKYIIIG